MAIYANISIDQGSDFTTEVTVEDHVGGDANLTGYIAAGQIRKTHTSSTAYDFVCTIPYPAQGVVNIYMPNSVTENIKAGRYVYDIEIKSPSNQIIRVLEGQVEVTPSVTRSL